MEEDDTANAAVDARVGSEQKLAVQPPVLLCVLHTDLIEPLGHAACMERHTGAEPLLSG